VHFALIDSNNRGKKIFFKRKFVSSSKVMMTVLPKKEIKGRGTRGHHQLFLFLD